MNYSELEELLLDPAVKLAEYDHCLRHSCNCRRVFHSKQSGKRVLRLQVAGSSCTDYSLFGKRLGQSGPAAPAFMVLILV